MDLCNCCANDPKEDGIDYIDKKIDCARCGKKKRSPTIKIGDMAKAVLAADARLRLRMSMKKSDSGPKCNVGQARVPLSGAKVQMRPTKNCKSCGLQKQVPRKEIKLEEVMVGHFGKQVQNGGATANKTAQTTTQKEEAQDTDKMKTFKNFLNKHDVVTIKVPMATPKISETIILLNSLNLDDFKPSSSTSLSSSTGAIKKSRNFMKFREHKSKSVPPLNKILSDLTLFNSASSELRKPPEEETINPGDRYYNMDLDPFDNDSMLVLPRPRFSRDKYKFQYPDYYTDYYTPDTETSAPIETICYSSSKLSQYSRSCPCLVQDRNFNEEFHPPKVSRSLYLRNLKLFNDQHDGIKVIRNVVRDEKTSEGTNFSTMTNTSVFKKPSKIQLGRLQTTTTIKRPRPKEEPKVLRGIHKSSLPMTGKNRQDEQVKNKIQGKISCQIENKKGSSDLIFENPGLKTRQATCGTSKKQLIPCEKGSGRHSAKVKIQDEKLSTQKNGDLKKESLAENNTNLTQVGNSYGSQNMFEPRFIRSCKNVLGKIGQLVKNNIQDKKAITCEENKVKDCKKLSVNEKTCLKSTEGKKFYGSLKMPEQSITKTCRNSNDHTLLGKGRQVIKHISNVTVQTKGKNLIPNVENAKKKLDNIIFGGSVTKRTNLRTTQTSDPYDLSKSLKPCKARAHLNSAKNQLGSQQRSKTIPKILFNDIYKFEVLKKKANNIKLAGLETALKTVKPFVPRTNRCQHTSFQKSNTAPKISVNNKNKSPKIEVPSKRNIINSILMSAKAAQSKRTTLDIENPKQISFQKCNTIAKISSNNKNNNAKCSVPQKGINKALESQSPLKPPNKLTKDNEELKKAISYLRLHQATTGDNNFEVPENPKCEPPRWVIAKNTLERAKDINTLFIKKRGKLDLPVYEPRRYLNKSISYCYENPENKANNKINMIKRREMQASKSQQQMKKTVLIQTKDKEINTIKEKSDKNLRKSLWSIFTTREPQKKDVQKLNADKPNFNHSASNSKNQIQFTKSNCSVNLKDLSPRMRQLIGVQTQKVPSSNNHKSLQQQNGLHLKGKVLEKKQSKLGEPKVETLPGEVAEPHENVIHSCSVELELNSSGLDKRFEVPPLEHKENSTFKENPHTSIKNPNKAVKPKPPSRPKIARKYPDTKKKDTKSQQQSKKSSPVAKTSGTNLGKHKTISASPVQKLRLLKTKRIVGKPRSLSKLQKFSKNHPITNLTLKANKVPKQNQGGLKENQLEPLNPIEPLQRLSNLIELPKEEVSEIMQPSKECVIFMHAREIGFRQIVYLGQVTPSHQYFVKMETIVLPDDVYIKRRSMIWADPVKEEQIVGPLILRNLNERTDEDICKNGNTIGRNQRRVFKHRSHVEGFKHHPRKKYENLKVKFEEQRSNEHERKKNLDGHLLGEDQVKGEELLKSLPKQSNQERKSDNTKTPPETTCRQEHLTSPRHYDFSNHPEIYNLQKSSIKNSNVLIESKKPIISKFIQLYRRKNVSRKRLNRFKKLKPAFRRYEIRKQNLCKFKPEETSHLLKSKQSASPQYSSSQEGDKAAIIKYQPGHDQVSNSSMTDSVGNTTFCFQSPKLNIHDSKVYEEIRLMLQSNLSTANLILVARSLLTERDDALKTSSKNRGKDLQVYRRHSRSDLASFLIPYLHINCSIHNCKHQMNGSSFLGHIAHYHLERNIFKRSVRQWKIFYNDSEASFSINPNKFVLGEITFLGLLAYGGDQDKELPVLLELCPKNTSLPATMYEIVNHCPIVLYACKLPIVEQQYPYAKEYSLIKKNYTMDERFIIWAACFPLPFKIRLKIDVQSGDFSNLISKTMLVRYFHKMSQDPGKFGQYDDEFLSLSYDDLMTFTKHFTTIWTNQNTDSKTVSTDVYDGDYDLPYNDGLDHLLA